jgi:ComF family protein
MRALCAAVFELLFPTCCLACKTQLRSSRPPLLCKVCRAKISLISKPFCSCCGAPNMEQHCRNCQEHSFAFDQARSLFLYQEEPIKSLILQLKFGRSLVGLSTFAALQQKDEAAALFQEPDLILPVPLHISRLRWRGFNQSLLVTETFFPTWKRKIHPDLLRRHRATVPQTRLDGAARRSNLAGAFSLCEPKAVQGRRVLLSDDVFTTGSTLHECAQVLRQAGAQEISAFTVARSAEEETRGDKERPAALLAPA